MTIGFQEALFHGICLACGQELIQAYYLDPFQVRTYHPSETYWYDDHGEHCPAVLEYGTYDDPLEVPEGFFIGKKVNDATNPSR